MKIMNRLNIQQSSNVEIVGADLIQKLYETALTTSDITLVGSLLCDHCKETAYNYLTGVENGVKRFPDLHIEATGGIYIDFADPEVERVLLANSIGDGVGITNADLAAMVSASWLPNFRNNTTITTFPELSRTNITTLGDNKFNGCTSLQSIDLSKIETLNGAVFYGCTSLGPTVNMPALTSITGDVCFQNCTSLTQINMPIITSINRTGTFLDCSNLQTVNIPNVTVIGADTFKNCTSLQTINAVGQSLDLSSVITIGDRAFYQCSNLSINASTLSNAQSLGWWAFYGCNTQGILNCPQLTYLGWGCFENSTNLQKATNLGSIEILRGSSFRGCSDLTEVVLPSQCVCLEEGAFYNCSNLEKVNLEQVQHFDLGNAWPFANCTKLRVQNYQNLLNPTGIAQNNVQDDHNYRTRASECYFIAPGATDLYIPKFDTLMGGSDDTGREFYSWFCGCGQWRKQTGDANHPPLNVLYLRDVTTVGKGAFCGCDIVNLVINSNTVPTVVDLQWGRTTSNGKLFEGNHTIQHIYVKPALVNDFKNDTYWGEKASIIESIENCPRKTAEQVYAGEVGLVEAWM